MKNGSSGIGYSTVKKLGKEMLILDEEKRIFHTKGKLFRLEMYQVT